MPPPPFLCETLQCLHDKTMSKGYHRQAYVLHLALCIVWMVAIATNIYTANLVTKLDTGLFTGSNFFTVPFWDTVLLFPNCYVIKCVGNGYQGTIWLLCNR